MIPTLRFDGYYVLSDLTGVPDILGRIKPILGSLVPGRKAGPRVTELKPWVRRVVGTYVVLMVPALLALLGMFVLTAPRIFATAYDSLGLQIDRVGDAVADGTVALAAVGVLQVITLVLPCLAIVLTATRIGRRAVGGLFGWASGSTPRTALAAAGTLAVAGFAAWTWWPNGDYEPIRPGERGTLSEVATSVTAIPSGRPAWTPQREHEHGREPTVRERRAADPGTVGPVGQDEEEVAPPATTTTPATETTPTTTTTPAPEAAPSETTAAPPADDPAAVPPEGELPPTETTPTVTTPAP
jgi:putative peptide zinc metalloprotease protein